MVDMTCMLTEPQPAIELCRLPVKSRASVSDLKLNTVPRAS